MLHLGNNKPSHKLSEMWWLILTEAKILISLSFPCSLSLVSAVKWVLLQYLSQAPFLKSGYRFMRAGIQEAKHSHYKDLREMCVFGRNDSYALANCMQKVSLKDLVFKPNVGWKNIRKKKTHTCWQSGAAKQMLSVQRLVCQLSILLSPSQVICRKPCNIMHEVNVFLTAIFW